MKQTLFNKDLIWLEEQLQIRTYEDIARDFGVAADTVAKYCNNNGIYSPRNPILKSVDIDCDVYDFIKENPDISHKELVSVLGKIYLRETISNSLNRLLAEGFIYVENGKYGVEDFEKILEKRLGEMN